MADRRRTKEPVKDKICGHEPWNNVSSREERATNVSGEIQDLRQEGLYAVHCKLAVEQRLGWEGWLL